MWFKLTGELGRNRFKERRVNGVYGNWRRSGVSAEEKICQLKSSAVGSS